MRSWRRFPSRPAAATMAGRRKPPSDRDRRADRRLRCGARRWSGASRPAAPPVPECAPRGRPARCPGDCPRYCHRTVQRLDRDVNAGCPVVGGRAVPAAALRGFPGGFGLDAEPFGQFPVGEGDGFHVGLSCGLSPDSTGTRLSLCHPLSRPSRGSSISGRSLRRPARSAAP